MTKDRNVLPIHEVITKAEARASWSNVRSSIARMCTTRLGKLSVGTASWGYKVPAYTLSLLTMHCNNQYAQSPQKSTSAQVIQAIPSARSRNYAINSLYADHCPREHVFGPKSID